MSPNLRIGFLVANTTFAKKLSIFNESTLQQPSGLSQVFIHTHLTDWGKQGFEQHVKYLQSRYTARRNTIIQAAFQHIDPKTATVSIPESGMFLWIKIHLPRSTPTSSWMDVIWNRLVELNVLLVPGYSFCTRVEAQTDHDSVPFVRLSFSIATDEEMTESMLILGQVLKEFGCGN